MRPGIEVRPARPGDLPQLVTICLAARRETAVGSQVCSPDEDTLAHQLGALTAAPGGTVLVAVSDDAVVGLLLGRVLGPNPFTDEVSLAVEAVYVDAESRRRGVGHALMFGATEVAAQAGAEHVYASPIPGARGMQRFFVRLGFTPAASHRVAQTAALQRRLADDAGVTGRPAPRGLEDLIARRRQSRRATPDEEDGGGSADHDAVQVGRRAVISRHVRRAVQTRREVESSTTIS